METVVAISLLGLIIIFVVNIFPGSVLAARSGNERIEAENLAESILEQTRASAFNSLTLGTTNVPSPDPKFTVTQEIFVPTNADADQTLGVRIIVQWESKSQTKSIQREVWLSSVRS